MLLCCPRCCRSFDLPRSLSTRRWSTLPKPDSWRWRHLCWLSPPRSVDWLHWPRLPHSVHSVHSAHSLHFVHSARWQRLLHWPRSQHLPHSRCWRRRRGYWLNRNSAGWHHSAVAAAAAVGDGVRNSCRTNPNGSTGGAPLLRLFPFVPFAFSSLVSNAESSWCFRRPSVMLRGENDACGSVDGAWSRWEVHVSANDLTSSNRAPPAVNHSRRKRRCRPVVADGVRLGPARVSPCRRSGCRRSGTMSTTVRGSIDGQENPEACSRWITDGRRDHGCFLGHTGRRENRVGS